MGAVVGLYIQRLHGPLNNVQIGINQRKTDVGLLPEVLVR